MSGILKEIHKFAFIDFEASSLSGQSWPIEVGLSWLEDGKAVGWSSLIRPDAAWDPADWSSISAAVHNIRRTDLYCAPSAEEVAHEVMERLGARVLLSDAPEFDQRWMDRLMRAVGKSGFRQILDFDVLTISSFDERALDHVYESFHAIKAPHRAGPDSLRMAKSWERGIEMTRRDPGEEMGPR